MIAGTDDGWTRRSSESSHSNAASVLLPNKKSNRDRQQRQQISPSPVAERSSSTELCENPLSNSKLSKASSSSKDRRQNSKDDSLLSKDQTKRSNRSSQYNDIEQKIDQERRDLLGDPVCLGCQKTFSEVSRYTALSNYCKIFIA